MAKAKTTRTASRTTAADAESNTRTSAATPEAAPTPREARDAAQKLFDKADEDGKAEMIEAARLSTAALGR